jgi:predicted ATP-binding protein involved in virulence
VNARHARLLFDGEYPIPVDELAPGERALLALGLNLVRGLAEAFPGAANPLEQRGVVLIDDLDVCFDGGRQREVGLWLRHNFPRLQVIASSHRPFLAQPGDPWNNVLLDQTSRSLPERSAQGRPGMLRAPVQARPVMACALS